LNREVADQIIPVADEDAIKNARELSRQEGIFCGVSSGATFTAALKVAEKAPKGSVILAMLPDTAERYLSSALFEGINDGTDPE
jgi:cysteine synthase A